MMKYLKASVKEVLEWAEKQNFFLFNRKMLFIQKILKPNYQITEIKKLQNENLKALSSSKRTFKQFIR